MSLLRRLTKRREKRNFAIEIEPLIPDLLSDTDTTIVDIPLWTVQAPNVVATTTTTSPRKRRPTPLLLPVYKGVQRTSPDTPLDRPTAQHIQELASDNNRLLSLLSQDYPQTVSQQLLITQLQSQLRQRDSQLTRLRSQLHTCQQQLQKYTMKPKNGPSMELRHPTILRPGPVASSSSPRQRIQQVTLQPVLPSATEDEQDVLPELQLQKSQQATSSVPQPYKAHAPTFRTPMELKAAREEAGSQFMSFRRSITVSVNQVLAHCRRARRQVSHQLRHIVHMHPYSCGPDVYSGEPVSVDSLDPPAKDVRLMTPASRMPKGPDSIRGRGWSFLTTASARKGRIAELSAGSVC